MNYEKLHKESLRIAHQMVSEGKITVGDAKRILPDFVTESEDERIREEIRDFICWATDRGSITKEQMEKSNLWLAWLEKQGEENHISRDTKPRTYADFYKRLTEPEQEYLQGYIDRVIEKTKELQRQGEQKPAPDWMLKFLDELRAKKNYFDWDEHRDIEGGILAIINWMNPNYFNGKDGEQKPDTQHSIEWSVSDFRTWQYIVSDVLTKKDGIGQYLDSGECKKIAKYMQEEWSKKLNIEQKHTELLKGEDYGIDGLYHAIDILERTLGKVSGYQSDDGILEHKAAITAVKKLKEQKPVGWSEEDEKMLSDIIKDLVHPWNEYIPDRIEEEIKWLKNRVKSLRPQNHWKPNEEQINALSITVKHGCTDDKEALGELLEQLKAL